jgi:hypothetical protein
MQSASRPESAVRLNIGSSAARVPAPVSTRLLSLSARPSMAFRPAARQAGVAARPRPFPRWLGTTLATLLLLLVSILVPPAAARAEDPHEAVVSAAVGYLRTRVTPEGGLDAFGSGPDPSTSARAIIALANAGLDQVLLANPDTGKTPLDFLISTGITYTHEPGFTDAAHLFPGNAGLTIAALAAAGRDPREAAGTDLVVQLEKTLWATGAYSTTATAGFTTGEALAPNQAWAILGLSMAGRVVPLEGITYLVSMQDPDGGWLAGDPDTTGLAIVALMSTGQVDTTAQAIVRGLSFLRRTQLPNGGWRPAWDTEPLNADSTAWAIQAFLACGYSPPLAVWNSSKPEATLASLQQADGSLGGQYASAYSTAEALLGLNASPLLLSPALRIERGLAWLADQARDPALTPGMAVDIATAFAAAGYDPRTVAAANGSLMARIASQASEYARGSVDQAGKLAMLLSSAGGGQLAADVDLAAIIASDYEPSVRAYGVVTNTYHQAYGLLGTAASATEIPDGAADALLSLQQPDGGWKYDLSEAPWNTTTPDNTGLAVQALLAAGITTDEPGVQRAFQYLRLTQDAQGGWGNANATALALQALVAARENPSNWTTTGDRTPLLALAHFGKLDGPAVWMWESPFGPPVDNVMATVQYVPALAGKPILVPGLSLSPYQRIGRGPDPDRLIIGELRFALRDGQVHVSLSVSSDQDGDATVTLAWLAPGMTAWADATVPTRSRGEISARLPESTPGCYLFRVIIHDPDGLEHQGQAGQIAVLLAQVPPETWLNPQPASGAAMSIALDYWVK